jgi:hypothetical protein
MHAASMHGYRRLLPPFWELAVVEVGHRRQVRSDGSTGSGTP